MVGSVLMQRMRKRTTSSTSPRPVFFTTSQVGQAGPDIGKAIAPLKDAMDVDALREMEAIVTCQGGDTPTRSTRSCARPAGKATGSTRRPRCA